MTPGDERDEQSDGPRQTEDLMKEAPPASVLGDVEDAEEVATVHTRVSF